METAKALQNRLDAVFGGLEGAGSSTKPWLPTLQPVFRAGRIETHSDDEDEKVEERRRQGLEGKLSVLMSDACLLCRLKISSGPEICPPHAGIEELLEEDPDRAPSYAFCRVVVSSLWMSGRGRPDCWVMLCVLTPHLPDKSCRMARRTSAQWTPSPTRWRRTLPCRPCRLQWTRLGVKGRALPRGWAALHSNDQDPSPPP